MTTKTVLITGANRGLGFALVKEYLAKKDWVVLACCRSPDKADNLHALQNDNLKIHELDVTSDESVNALKKDIGDHCIDVLINNAGIFGSHFEGENSSDKAVDYDVWATVFAVNTMGPLRVSQAFMDNIKNADAPKIITISSQMGSLNRKSAGYYPYRSSKAAVNKVMQTLAYELQDENVIVTMIHPGWVKTDMGGENAEITAETSAQGIAQVISNLTIKDSGKFYQYDGSEHPW